jgi:two-component system chemotaxis response regulator CheY
VLTDQHMPGKTGVDLIALLRANPAYEATPILLLTTESGEPFKAAARSAGATGWIEKPLDPDMLTELVATLSESGSED